MSVKFTVGDLHRELPPPGHDLGSSSNGDGAKPPTVADARAPLTTSSLSGVPEKPSVFESTGAGDGRQGDRHMEPVSIPDNVDVSTDQSIVPAKSSLPAGSSGPVQTGALSDTRLVALLGTGVIVMLGLTWYTGQHTRSTTVAQCGTPSEYLKWVVGLMFAFLVVLLGYFIWWCHKVLRKHHSHINAHAQGTIRDQTS